MLEMYGKKYGLNHVKNWGIMFWLRDAYALFI
jgi:hypothetical protein